MGSELDFNFIIVVIEKIQWLVPLFTYMYNINLDILLEISMYLFLSHINTYPLFYTVLLCIFYLIVKLNTARVSSHTFLQTLKRMLISCAIMISQVMSEPSYSCCVCIQGLPKLVETPESEHFVRKCLTSRSSSWVSLSACYIIRNSKIEVINHAVFANLHEWSIWVKVVSWIHVRVEQSSILPEFIQPSLVSNRTIIDTQILQILERIENNTQANK